MPHLLSIDLYQTAGIGVLALMLGFLGVRKNEAGNRVTDE